MFLYFLYITSVEIIQDRPTSYIWKRVHLTVFFLWRLPLWGLMDEKGIWFMGQRNMETLVYARGQYQKRAFSQVWPYFIVKASLMRTNGWKGCLIHGPKKCQITNKTKVYSSIECTFNKLFQHEFLDLSSCIKFKVWYT